MLAKLSDTNAIIIDDSSLILATICVENSTIPNELYKTDFRDEFQQRLFIYMHYRLCPIPQSWANHCNSLF